MGMSTFQSQTRFDRDKRFHVNEEDDSKSKHYACTDLEGEGGREFKYLFTQ